MKYAVIRYGSHQFKVSEGDAIQVPLMSDTSVKPEVLLVVDGEDVKVGNPTVEGAVVKTKVLAEDEKGEKIKVFKYKSKSRYRRKMGFRPHFTRLLVEKLS